MTQNYQLKKGVLLQAFGDASKTCTNNELTDELAIWYLKHFPEKIIYFEKIPQNVILPEIKIIPPAQDVVIIPPAEKQVDEVANDLIAQVIKPGRKSKAKK